MLGDSHFIFTFWYNVQGHFCFTNQAPLPCHLQHTFYPTLPALNSFQDYLNKLSINYSFDFLLFLVLPCSIPLFLFSSLSCWLIQKRTLLFSPKIMCWVSSGLSWWGENKVLWFLPYECWSQQILFPSIILWHIFSTFRPSSLCLSWPQLLLNRNKTS